MRRLLGDLCWQEERGERRDSEWRDLAHPLGQGLFLRRGENCWGGR